MLTDRTAAHAALDIFVGTWTAQVLVPGAPVGHVVFERALDGQYLVQHTTVPDPNAPDSLAVIAVDDSGSYVQHYFDARGVVRIYRMGLRDGVWTLERTAPDFSPLPFWQRFQGTFSADGDRIDGRWERSDDAGATWELDFLLTYTRDR